MQHYHNLEDLSLDGSWVTIGTFDGVHRGHRVILNHLVQGAHAAGLPAVVVTFYPHPAIVLRGLQGPFYLCSLEERLRLIADLGVDIIVTLPFNRELASETAEDFMADLVEHLHLSRLVVGHDFALGRGRAGDIHALRHIGAGLGYEVELVPAEAFDNQLISSTRIRDLVSKGQVSEAAKMLGRWYSLDGKVVHGDGRGKSIGIPTANLSWWNERIIPARGVYACLAWIRQQAIPAVTNIGLRPTFETGDTQARIEAHLLDYNEDLYGAELRLEFIKYLRSEQRFTSASELIDQIHTDIQNAREVLPYVP
jgi:riboflavin kinase / FMN adenylyltransferase